MCDREDIEGIDAAILMHPRVWEASGHVAGFVDPLVDCKKCKARFRAADVTTVHREAEAPHLETILAVAEKPA